MWTSPALRNRRSSAGLNVTGFTNQMSFLMGLGVDDMIGQLDPESPGVWRRHPSAASRMGWDGHSRSWCSIKGIERPDLDGLKFKPFFGSALTFNEAA